MELVGAAATAADHGSLKPWRLIELRGSARDELGAALAAAAGLAGQDDERLRRLAAKPLRAPLLIGIVAVRRVSPKVADWEQDAAAAGVAHLLSLLLDDAGWAVMWRTGPWTDAEPVRAVHRLAPSERLLGWLYVGGRPTEADDQRAPKRGTIDAGAFLTTLDLDGKDETLQ